MIHFERTLKLTIVKHYALKYLNNFHTHKANKFIATFPALFGKITRTTRHRTIQFSRFPQYIVFENHKAQDIQFSRFPQYIVFENHKAQDIQFSHSPQYIVFENKRKIINKTERIKPLPQTEISFALYLCNLSLEL